MSVRMCVCLYVCAMVSESHMSPGERGGQRTVCRHQVFPVTVWVLGTKLSCQVYQQVP